MQANSMQFSVLCDDFKGHSEKNFKSWCLELKPEMGWLIMGGGLTPEGQALDKLINKIWKSLYRDEYDEYSLTCPTNATTGHPLAPSRQQMAHWIVDSWDEIPADLVKKAWTACGYLPQKDLAQWGADAEGVAEGVGGPLALKDVAAAIELCRVTDDEVVKMIMSSYADEEDASDKIQYAITAYNDPENENLFGVFPGGFEEGGEEEGDVEEEEIEWEFQPRRSGRGHKRNRWHKSGPGGVG